MQYMKNYITPDEVARLCTAHSEGGFGLRGSRRIYYPRASLMFLDLAGSGNLCTLGLGPGVHDLNKRFARSQRERAAYVLPIRGAQLYMTDDTYDPPLLAELGDALLLGKREIKDAWLTIIMGEVLVLFRQG